MKAGDDASAAVDTRPVAPATIKTCLMRMTFLAAGPGTAL
jgi:hypothetical protein